MNRDFYSLDGTRLSGDSIAATGSVARSVLLVHGAGVDRHEDGFYDRAVDQFQSAGLGVFRFDLRGHGKSEGVPQDLTIAGALNDIVAAWLHVTEFTGGEPAFALGSSFGGGLLALATLRLTLERVAFVNPLLKFRKRFLEDKTFWSRRGLAADMREELASQGYLPHVGPIVMSKAFVNEVLWLDPFDLVKDCSAKALVLHGTSDSRAPFAVAQQWASRVGAHLVPFEGAEHGLCVADDDDFTDPQTLAWQGAALTKATEWFLRND
jgi:uncharacterized protein